MRLSKGFTLIELVLVILIASILAAFAMAKVGLFSGIQEAGAAQSFSGFISGAQRLAIANRRNIYMVHSASKIDACYDALCATPATNFDGSAMSLAVPTGSITYTSASYYFDPQGRPSFSGSFSVVYSGQTVHIEPDTGLVW